MFFFFGQLSPLKSFRILWMSCCLHFYAFTQIFQSLFLFIGCASPLLDESQDFSIFVREFFTHFGCCRCRHVRFFVVVLELARVAAGL